METKFLPEVSGRGKDATIEVESVVKLDGPELTDAELEQASSEAGLVVLDSRRIKGLAKVGKYLRRAGMIEVKRGRMVARMDALERARRVMLDMVEDKVVFMGEDDKPVVHHSVVLSAANALVAIVEAENKCDELDLEMEKKLRLPPAAPPEAPTNQIPPPNVPFVAIQEFNQHNHGPNSVVGKQGEPP